MCLLCLYGPKLESNYATSCAQCFNAERTLSSKGICTKINTLFVGNLLLLFFFSVSEIRP
jgi:hypothetical protein